jgi:hypothetical protein
MNKPIEAGQNFTIGITRSSLEGKLIYACKHCRAPGVYHNSEHIKAGWPGCYDPTRDGQPVGDVCPNCLRLRSGDKNLGELKASIPLWVWNTVLGFKRLVVGTRKLQSRFRSKLS